MSILNYVSFFCTKTQFLVSNSNTLLKINSSNYLGRVFSSGLAYVPDVAPAELGIQII